MIPGIVVTADGGLEFDEDLVQAHAGTVDCCGCEAHCTCPPASEEHHS